MTFLKHILIFLNLKIVNTFIFINPKANCIKGEEFSIDYQNFIPLNFLHSESSYILENEDEIKKNLENNKKESYKDNSLKYKTTDGYIKGTYKNIKFIFR